MSNQLTTVPQDEFTKSLMEIEETQKMCAALMRTPHYSKMGEVGIFTIVQKARSVGLNPLDALNGAMYFVNGKVELSANTMNYMIRVQGHSITKDEKSNHECCILRGKRADNGDSWMASFSIREAKQAGIYKSTWEKYPEDMLFARALTRLARQLFPDVIKGCYVEGEIQDAISSERHVEPRHVEPPKQEKISTSQAAELCEMLSQCSDEFQEEIKNFCKKSKFGDNLEGLPVDLLERLTKAISNKIEETRHKLPDTQESLESLEA